eukprot:765807-Hanusia_phi.AAC.1
MGSVNLHSIPVQSTSSGLSAIRPEYQDRSLEPESIGTEEQEMEDCGTLKDLGNDVINDDRVDERKRGGGGEGVVEQAGTFQDEDILHASGDYSAESLTLVGFWFEAKPGTKASRPTYRSSSFLPRMSKIVNLTLTEEGIMCRTNPAAVGAGAAADERKDCQRSFPGARRGFVIPLQADSKCFAVKQHPNTFLLSSVDGFCKAGRAGFLFRARSEGVCRFWIQEINREILQSEMVAANRTARTRLSLQAFHVQSGNVKKDGIVVRRRGRSLRLRESVAEERSRSGQESVTEGESESRQMESHRQEQGMEQIPRTETEWIEHLVWRMRRLILTIQANAEERQRSEGGEGEHSDVCAICLEAFPPQGDEEEFAGGEGGGGGGEGEGGGGGGGGGEGERHLRSCLPATCAGDESEVCEVERTVEEGGCHQEDVGETRLRCRHRFHLSCLQQYLRTKIDDGQVFRISCPSCPEQLDERCMEGLLPAELFARMMRIAEKRRKEMERGECVCPSPECGGEIERLEDQQIEEVPAWKVAACQVLGTISCFLLYHVLDEGGEGRASIYRNMSLVCEVGEDSSFSHHGGYVAEKTVKMYVIGHGFHFFLFDPRWQTIALDCILPIMLPAFAMLWLNRKRIKEALLDDEDEDEDNDDDDDDDGDDGDDDGGDDDGDEDGDEDGDDFALQ